MSLVLNNLLGGSPTPTPPVVANVSPTGGSSIVATQAIQFDVTDDSGLFRRIFVEASFPAVGLREVIHDGDSFAPLYSSTSTRVAITGGFRYNVRRAGGWPASPTLTCFAIDQQGAENT